MALIDVLLSIVLLGIAAGAFATLSSRLAAQSAQALTDRQALAFAYGLLAQVRNADNAIPYHGFTMPGPGCAGLCDAAGTVVNGAGSALHGCGASVTVQPQALAGIAALDGTGQPQVVRIAVTLTCPGRSAVLAEGFRVRYAAAPL